MIPAEVYRDLLNSVEDIEGREAPPRFDIGLDTRELISRLELFKSLDGRHLEGMRKLLRPRFTVPGELIVRKGERGDAVFFIASGATEVRFPIAASVWAAARCSARWPCSPASRARPTSGR